MAETLLERLKRERPEYFTAPVRSGFQRGVHAYRAGHLELAFDNAVRSFQAAHGRPPDLLSLPEAADHFFKMKFFDDIPVPPNPASKLQCANYVPQHLRRRIRIPARPWVSLTPELPADHEVPPATYYWLKLEFGNGKHVRLPWPPDARVREAAQKRLTEQFPVRTWSDLGEWWYGLSRQRAYLEEDLSRIIRTGMEVKVYVRRGVAVAGYLVRYDHEKSPDHSGIAFFDGAGRHLPGTLRLSGMAAPYAQMGFSPPPDFRGLLAAAGEIGRPFDLVRVDLIVSASGEAYLGELSLCHGSATVVFEPKGFADDMRDRLFSPLVSLEAAS